MHRDRERRHYAERAAQEQQAAHQQAERLAEYQRLEAENLTIILATVRAPLMRT